MFEESGEPAVGEDFAGGLAGGAVVTLVCRITDALDRGVTYGAGLVVFAVDGHLRMEGGDFVRESVADFPLEALGPLGEDVAGRFEQTLDFVLGQFRGVFERREAGAVQDFVGVGVADAGEEARVRQGPLEGVIFTPQAVVEVPDRSLEHFDATSIEFGQGSRPRTR